jgi:AcrR family transcriptional regulator
VTETKSRRRGAALEQAILDAAWAELRDTGYTGLTIEAVATRAGTSKPVIYRRWSSRAELVLAAWSRQAPAPLGLPGDTGALRSDLVALFTRIARRVDTMMSEMIAGVMGEAFRHPEVIALLQERLKTAPLSDGVRTIVRRAVDRGELAPVELPQRATRVPLDLIRNEAMVFGAPIPDETINELIDDVYLPLLRGLALE